VKATHFCCVGWSVGGCRDGWRRSSKVELDGLKAGRERASVWVTWFRFAYFSAGFSSNLKTVPLSAFASY
jgi:hypothetical protein